MRKSAAVLVVAAAAAVVIGLGCSSDKQSSSSDSSAGSDSNVSNDASDGAAVGDSLADGPPEVLPDAGPIPAPPPHSGVVYVGHFMTEELRIYRVDDSYPSQEDAFDLGKVTHDLQLDPFNDLLVVVSDISKTVDLFRLSRPASASQKVTPPAKIATIATAADKRPMFALINPHRHRLYVVVAPDSADYVTEYELFAYDTSAADDPKLLAGSPYLIPVTSSMALDSQRDLFFVVSQKEKLLHGFSLAGDSFSPLGGEPLELLALYPQQHVSFGFQARSLTVDPYRRRMYAARSQADLSELIALEYPDRVTAMSDLKMLADPFDVDTPSEQRPHLNDAFVPAIDLESGAVFLSAGAYQTIGTYGLMTVIDSDMRLGEGCGDFEGFGCWYATYDAGEPSIKVRTDGAACVDPTHGIAVGTVVADDEAEPGAVLFWRYTEQLTMEPFLQQSGSLLGAGGLPVAVVCH